jgi:CheY-like chemotaxis protein
MVSAHSSARSILVVEDHFDLRDTLTELLQEEGYEVMSAGSGGEALDHLRSAPPPSVILLDLMMPGMDGWQFREEQRQDPRLAAIPVVVISADEAAVQAWASREPAGCLKKPFDLPTLLQTIEDAEGPAAAPCYGT